MRNVFFLEATLAFAYLTYLKERKAVMTEERTSETNGSRSFEERVFARFDGMDDRFERIEVRIEKLEMRQYDTKPIWEQALAAIAETNRVMAAGFEALRAEIKVSEDALSAEIATTNT